MKVGTDGVLLGAWCPCAGSRILDIGTGSGLIALMLAQRCPKAEIDAIDIDEESVKQARENFEQSPWASRLHAQCIALQDFQSQILNFKYDTIVSNPPYFVDSLKNPNRQRQTARHTDSLSYSELVGYAAELLSEAGLLSLVLPAEAEAQILSEAAQVGLFPTRLTHVYTKPGKPMKRVLVAFSRTRRTCQTEDFYIESETSPRSAAYQKLTEAFYL